MPLKKKKSLFKRKKSGRLSSGQENRKCKGKTREVLGKRKKASEQSVTEGVLDG